MTEVIVNTLQSDLAGRIVDLASSEAWPTGHQLVESQLAKLFKVSRTPVRAALKILEANGLVELLPNKGFVTSLEINAEHRALFPDDTCRQVIATKIVSDRATGRIGQDVSENELTLRYGVSRGVVRRALIDMMAEGIVRRQPGHGWAFSNALSSADAIRQSYSFRIAVETAGLMEEDFKVDKDEYREVMNAHLHLQELSAERIREGGWFGSNAKFHEILARWSGNSFIEDAVRSQNGLRKLNETSLLGDLPDTRIFESVGEHLSILVAIGNSEQDLAALLLKKHLQNSQTFAVKEI